MLLKISFYLISKYICEKQEGFTFSNVRLMTRLTYVTNNFK